LAGQPAFVQSATGARFASKPVFRAWSPSARRGRRAKPRRTKTVASWPAPRAGWSDSRGLTGEFARALSVSGHCFPPCRRNTLTRAAYGPSLKSKRGPKAASSRPAYRAQKVPTPACGQARGKPARSRGASQRAGMRVTIVHAGTLSIATKGVERGANKRKGCPKAAPPSESQRGASGWNVA
jgi:hypothetical protein